MTPMVLKRFQVLMPAIAALALVLSGPTPASAAECTAQLSQCYQDAASAGEIWAIFSAGLDCEISYAGCVRAELMEA